ncbi:MAG: diaminobutyrate acetyltransferase [Opitutales bacterium]
MNATPLILLIQIIDIQIQHPCAEDAYSVNQLIAQSPPLDTNSVYCNLLQCSHFADTSVIAKSGETIVGFISGYRLPSRPEVLFVWQVVVSSQARGQGLAGRMLQAQVDAGACTGVRYMETTITKDNAASRALFQKFADKNDAPLQENEFFDRERHFNGQHDSEYLIRIGPFPKQ